jgi:hypothetical protein
MARSITKKVREKLVRRIIYDMLREYAPTNWMESSENYVLLLTNLFTYKDKSKKIKKLRELCKKHYVASLDIRDCLVDMFYKQFKKDYSQGDDFFDEEYHDDYDDYDDYYDEYD